MEKIRKWFKSKTINMGLILVLVGSLEMNFHYLKVFLSDKWYGATYVAIGLLVVILRFLTTTSLMEKK